MSEQRYHHEVMSELEQEQAQEMMEYEHYMMMQEMHRQYMAEQDDCCLPIHKQLGYTERLCEQADIRRKELRENGL